MRIACLQTNPGDDVTANLEQVESLLRTVSGRVDVAVLPEMFTYMGPEKGRLATAHALGEGTFAWLAGLARELGIALVGGSHAETSAVAGRVHNTLVTFDRAGRSLVTYRKIHLFNLRDAQGKPLYCESDVLSPGTRAEGFLLESQGNTWHCFAAICYDLRFPELFRQTETRVKPYDVVFLPAAFTHQTGQDHWEVLLRARAIENQCYVVACNQTGTHTNGTKRNYGHSLVVDPWGRVTARLGEEEGILEATLDLSVIREARTRLPALADRVL